MWFPTADFLTKADEGGGFLLLAWQELFSPRTPDSFQPKLLHLPALVEELEQISMRATRSQKWEKHVRKIQEELKASCELEQAFLERMPRYHWTIERLCQEGIKCSEISSVARTLQDFQKSHDSSAYGALQDAASKLPKNKDAALDALRRVATIALRRGCTAEDFDRLMLPENLSRSSNEIVRLVIEAIHASSKKYLCIIAVQGEKQDLQVIARKVGFALVSTKHLPAHAETNAFVENTKGKVLLSINVDASKPTEAANKAFRLLRPALDVFNFYQHDALCFFDEVLVVENEVAPVRVQSQKQWIWQLRQRRNARQLTKGLLDSATEKRFSGRLLNALEHYSLAQTSAAVRVRLVNLWSALECLTTGDQSESIISSVCSAVAPIVVWRRTAKLLSYTALNLSEFRSTYGGSLGSGFPTDEKGISGERLIMALARPEGDPYLEELQKSVAQHPYLRFRIFSLWKSFKTPVGLAKELKASAARTEWHLHRIYRARNLIVHEGQEIQHVGRLLENLHYYFSLTLSRILHGMEMNSDWGVEDSITHWRTRYDYVVNSLEKRPAALQISDFLPKPRASLANSQIWPEPAAISST